MLLKLQISCSVLHHPIRREKANLTKIEQEHLMRYIMALLISNDKTSKRRSKL